MKEPSKTIRRNDHNQRVAPEYLERRRKGIPSPPKLFEEPPGRQPVAQDVRWQSAGWSFSTSRLPLASGGQVQ